jgi:hypothetical protein
MHKKLLVPLAILDHSFPETQRAVVVTQLVCNIDASMIVVAWDPRAFFPLGEAGVEGVVPLHWQTSIVSADVQNAIDGLLQHVRIIGVVFTLTLDPKLGIDVTELVWSEMLGHVVHANFLKEWSVAGA